MISSNIKMNMQCYEVLAHSWPFAKEEKVHFEVVGKPTKLIRSELHRSQSHILCHNDEANQSFLRPLGSRV